MTPIWLTIMIFSIFFALPAGYRMIASKKWFKILLIIGLAAFLMVEGQIIAAGFSESQNTESEYMSVLGARVYGDIPSLTLRNRLDVATVYLELHEETEAILSGGQGTRETSSEAQVMKNYLIQRGISEDRLTIEDESYNTQDNIVNSFKIITKDRENASVHFVTNHFHVFRAQLIAKKYGYEVSGIGAKTMSVLIPNYYMREFFAVVKELIF